MPTETTQSRYRGTAPNLDGVRPIELDRFSFYAVWRDTERASGVTLHVFGPRHENTEEVLRFDCFDAPAHYHLGWSYLDRPFVKIDADDPLAWSLNALRTDMDKMLFDAEADGLNKGERDMLDAAVNQLHEMAAALSN